MSKSTSVELMKIGVVGKGGVGKTTVAALLARAFAERGLRVVAVDTDSNPNLGLSLGLSAAATEAVPVLPRSVVVGRRGDVTVDDLLEQFGCETPAGVTVLSALRVTEAGAGCTCGGHATVRSLLGEALDAYTDITIVDMEAGIEHLSRSGGTLAHADVLVMVVEASRKAVLTAARTQTLAAELGIPRCVGVANKTTPDDRAVLEALCREYDVPLVSVLPADRAVPEADRRGGGASRDEASALWAGIDDLADLLLANAAI